MKKLILFFICVASSVLAQTPVVPDESHGSSPPDPTVRTIEQIRREILSLRELQEGKLQGMEKAMDAVQKSLGDRQQQIDKTVDKLQELQNEKFAGVQRQFEERDGQTDKTAELNQKAIDAAFQAASATNLKSEASFTKQIDALTNLISASNKALDDKIGDLKDRLTTIDGRSAGRDDTWGYLVGGVGVLVGIVSLVIVSRKEHPPNSNGNGNGNGRRK